jgi:hypothetical protein
MADLALLAPSTTDRTGMRFRVRLEATVIALRLNFNTRARSWTLDLEAEDGSPIVRGLRLVEGVDLLAPFRYDGRLPPGQLFVRDTSGAHRDPGRDDLRADVRIVYRPAADVELARGTSAEVW